MNKGQIVFASAATTMLLLAELASGGIGGTGVRSKGTATEKGSVVVSGIKYETSASLVYLNNVVGTEDDLKVGQILDIEGNVDPDGTTGVALVVRVNDTIRGVVDSVNKYAGTVTIAGQIIRVSRTTVFDRALSDDIEDLEQGDFLTVFAQFDDGSTPHATRLESAQSWEGIRVTGDIDAWLSSSTIVINNQRIDVSGAVIDGGSLETDTRIVADGLTLGANDELLATRVRVLEREFASSGSESVSVSGLISDFSSFASFAVDGQRVVADWNTAYASSPFALGANREVVVQGLPAADGSVLATNIRVLDSADSTIRGRVTGIDDDEIEIDYNTTIGFDGYARFQDRTADRALAFGLHHLSLDDEVEIHIHTDDGAVEGVFLVRESRGGFNMNMSQIFNWFVAWLHDWNDNEDDEDDD